MRTLLGVFRESGDKPGASDTLPALYGSCGMKKSNVYFWSGSLAVMIVFCDIALKNWVIGNLELLERRELIPGVLGLLHTQNTGAAFGMFSQFPWILTVLSGLAILAMVVAVAKKWFTHPWALLALGAVWGGALGNFIDRMRFGYVVDMFEFLFIHFAIFNVADIFVTTGGIALALYIFFLHKDEKPKAASNPEGDRHA